MRGSVCDRSGAYNGVHFPALEAGCMFPAPVSCAWHRLHVLLEF